MSGATTPMVRITLGDGTPWEIPQGWIADARGYASCRSCGARIVWCKTTKGRRAPVDQDGHSHFATCPQAESWRRPR